MAGAFLGMGFQAPALKFASVDMEKVFSEADVTKKSNDQLEASQKARMNVLQFVQQNPAMLPADAEKYAAAATRSPQTAADKADIERITQDALAASNRQRDLATKQNPAADDMKALQDFSSRGQQNGVLARKLQEQYTTEMREMQVNLHAVSMDKIRESVKEIASKQGYSIVFSQEAAPFAANDLTAEAIKALKKS